MVSLESKFLFPKTPVTLLVKNTETYDKNDLLKLIKDIRQSSDKYENSRIEGTKIQIDNIDKKIILNKEILTKIEIQSIKKDDEILGLRQAIEILESEKFVLEISICMSMRTIKNVNIMHRNAKLVSKFMLKTSTCFQVDKNGKIDHGRKVSCLSNLEPILEDDLVDSSDSEEE